MVLARMPAPATGIACASRSGQLKQGPIPSCRSLPLASMSQTGDGSELVAYCGVRFSSELVPREARGCEQQPPRDSEQQQQHVKLSLELTILEDLSILEIFEVTAGGEAR